MHHRRMDVVGHHRKKGPFDRGSDNRAFLTGTAPARSTQSNRAQPGQAGTPGVQTVKPVFPSTSQ